MNLPRQRAAARSAFTLLEVLIASSLLLGLVLAGMTALDPHAGRPPQPPELNRHPLSPHFHP